GVRRVRVAGAGRGEDLVLVAGEARDRLPRGAVAFEERGERAVDVALVHRPDEQRRHEATVLADLVDVSVARPAEQQVLRDAVHLVRLAHTTEEVHVGLGLPGAEPRARPRARGAALLAVQAVVRSELFFEVIGPVALLDVVVADDVVGTRHHAARTTRAQARLDDLGVELLPLVRPSARG